ncbi:MAG TPA: MoxR family ATPase [Pirellulaceae bacterium]|nr:MoxR family ATPase [Pirellulaceae bacterium]HMO92098.1 MoxR family ATPase [Pirellulaceae bacterium]HMP69314.1 MoxR family ATPase [Pirellulaceae bacterium]
MSATAETLGTLQFDQGYSIIRKLEENISGVVLGKSDVARMCVVTLLAGEHLLLEDVPGVGKTLMGKALARSVDGEFRRIQFTPDLLPSDILGSCVFNTKTQEFIFNRGPIFSNFVLADEINRAPPRTQSALLEAMSDHQVSVDGTTHDLPQPFMVIATQNPFEFEGTYVLPESQLDRFLMRISMGYPSREFEQELLLSHRNGEPVDTLSSVVNSATISQVQNLARQVRVDQSIESYILDVVRATRASSDLRVGVSTRGVLLWYRACQALALASGRDYVTPDDVKHLALPILGHRVMAKGIVQGGQRDSVEGIVRRIVEQVPIPG